MIESIWFVTPICFILQKKHEKMQKFYLLNYASWRLGVKTKKFVMINHNGINLDFNSNLVKFAKKREITVKKKYAKS